MSHETMPQPEHRLPWTPETYPQPGMFNVSAMSNEQIAIIGRALDREDVRIAGTDSPVADELTALLEHLGADIAQLAITQPTRGRALITHLVRSPDVYDRNTAAVAAIPLGLRGDYEFARDTLLIACQRDWDSLHDIHGLAEPRLQDLRDLLKMTRPDLAEDLEQRFYAIHPGH